MFCDISGPVHEVSLRDVEIEQDPLISHVNYKFSQDYALAIFYYFIIVDLLLPVSVILQNCTLKNSKRELQQNSIIC